MKGVIFNLLEGAVTEQHGADTWDDVVDAAGVDGAYSAVGSYADEEFVALLQQLPAEHGDVAQRLVWFGESAMPMLAERYREFFTPHRSVIDFLPTLNDLIHPEVRKLYPGADVPFFGVDRRDEHTIALTYSSARRLCALARGFISGAASMFGERVTVTEERCALRGAESCLLVCRVEAA